MCDTTAAYSGLRGPIAFQRNGLSFGIVLSRLRSNACRLKLVPNLSPCHRPICAGRRRSDVLTRVGRQLIETIALNKYSGHPDRAGTALAHTPQLEGRRERFVLPSVARFSLTNAASRNRA
jgi:hypothetical protein